MQLVLSCCFSVYGYTEINLETGLKSRTAEIAIANRTGGTSNGLPVATCERKTNTLNDFCSGENYGNVSRTADSPMNDSHIGLDDPIQDSRLPQTLARLDYRSMLDRYAEVQRLRRCIGGALVVHIASVS